MSKSNKFKWTDEQKKFLNLNKMGRFVIKACPGSGKTAAVSERVYRFIKKWNDKKSGIAVLSFTNIAADEIKENLNKYYRLDVDYPHFVGTLDSFINTYIFLPYGKLVMGCKNRPMLVGDPFSYWASDNYLESQFDKVNFLINGDVNFPEYLNISYDDAKKMKYDLMNKGFSTQKDAIYHSMRVLIKYPQIANALSLRFPHIIIDEAQDTSDIHMKIVDLLIEAGLKNIVLVGDSEQSIYDWNGAKPRLFNYKFREWEENSIIFHDNFRSSQKICDFFSKLSEIDYIDSKCLHDSDYPPNIVSHRNNFDDIISNFIDECNKCNIPIDEKNVCVLFRGNNEVNVFKKSFKLNNIYKLFKYHPNPISFTVNIVEGLFQWNNKNYFEGFKKIEREYLKLKNDSFRITNNDIFDEIKKIGFQNHRGEVIEFINSFPPIKNNQTIDSWIEISNESKESMFSFNKINDKKINNTPYHSKEVTFELLFNDINKINDLNYHVGTVHSVKGGSFDAVILILKNRTEFGDFYKDLLWESTNLSENSELRVIYVALSRSKKLLYLAVPENDYGLWNSLFS